MVSLHQKVFLVELLSWRQSKRNGRLKGERGGGEETLARKPRDSGKHLLIFHWFFIFQIDSLSTYSSQ